jgi:hypothetical protein
MHKVIFEADAPAGKAYDVALIPAILMSVAAEMLDSSAPFACSSWAVPQRGAVHRPGAAGELEQNSRVFLRYRRLPWDSAP